ncbi:MAG: hypothetical protein ACRD2I_24915, partial [Vicinamibacterales bacterium]
ESDQTRPEILAVYEGSELLRDLVEYRDGYFFPLGRGDMVAERRRREVRSDRFLAQHRLALRLICALPFTRLVALSGSIAHRNLEPDGDLDLFIVTRGARVWTVTVMVLVLTKLLRRRRTICANFVLADSHLRLDQQDLFSANQVIHLQPLIGADVVWRFRDANPFVARCYPNSGQPGQQLPLVEVRGRWLNAIKCVLQAILGAASPVVESVCRRAYAWHLRRRAGSWRSPDQVRLQADYLKLHTQSHRHAVLDRFEATVDTLMRMAKLPRRDDLFQIFPDLPGMRPRTAAEQIERVHRKVQDTRERAEQNILRQKAASERVRAAISIRRRR